jgi:hypothetical protein
VGRGSDRELAWQGSSGSENLHGRVREGRGIKGLKFERGDWNSGWRLLRGWRREEGDGNRLLRGCGRDWSGCDALPPCTTRSRKRSIRGIEWRGRGHRLLKQIELWCGRF